MSIAKPCINTLLVVTCAGVLAACGSSTSQGAAGSSTGSTSPHSTIAAASLPLGDGKVASSPRVGYLDSCQQKFPPGAPGAVANVPWIHNTSWDPGQKIVVQGKVRWPRARITITLRGNSRVIHTLDLPVDATTGTFPISPSSAAYRYDRNPNKIVPQNDIFELPRNPLPARQPGCLGSGPIGVLTNGVLLFDALDAAGRDAPAHEIQDSCDGHPDQRDVYHYHSVSACVLANATGHSTLVGYAVDGYGIYVERDAHGKLLTDADLDACHGRVSPVLWNGRRERIYHYDATPEYPYTIGCFRAHSIIKQGALTGPPPGGPPSSGAPAS